MFSSKNGRAPTHSLFVTDLRVQNKPPSSFRKELFNNGPQNKYSLSNQIGKIETPTKMRLQQTASHGHEKGSSVLLGNGSVGAVKNEHGKSRYGSMKMLNDGIMGDVKKAPKVAALKAVSGTSSLQKS